MARSNRFVCFAALAACAGLAGCAGGNYHYSQLLGTRYYRVPIDTYSVSILRVDGKDFVIRPAQVDPGLRQVTVQGPPGGTGGIGQERTFALEIAPCTRYYLVAVKENRLGNDFTLRIDHQEPVGGCSPPPAG